MLENILGICWGYLRWTCWCFAPFVLHMLVSCWDRCIDFFPVGWRFKGAILHCIIPLHIPKLHQTNWELFWIFRIFPEDFSETSLRTVRSDLHQWSLKNHVGTSQYSKTNEHFDNLCISFYRVVYTICHAEPRRPQLINSHRSRLKISKDGLLPILPRRVCKKNSQVSTWIWKK
jgi:hypothetical protein